MSDGTRPPATAARKRPAAKKTAAKNTAARKSAVTRTPVKKATAKQAAAKQASSKKTAAKKAPARKTVTKRTTPSRSTLSVVPDDALEADDDLSMRDAEYVGKWLPILRLVVKTWYRSEVRDIERVPGEGGALMVSNHSGGLIAMDVPIIAVAFHDHFGADRPLYTLAHDLLFTGSIEQSIRRAGFVEATRSNASAVLRRGAVTIVFPGGDYDTFRPVWAATKIDFAGRKGYVRTALEANVPIVPVVSHGGQEDQIHLWRGERIARMLRLDKLLRTAYAPVTIGFPFGLTFGFPPNLPLPTKIVTQVLEPIDVRAEFGDDPDVEAVDREIRRRMQRALDALARERRFPVIG
jgi:1-acyl-sn-glycerol-3-phosphate acyltransferase